MTQQESLTAGEARGDTAGERLRVTMQESGEGSHSRRGILGDLGEPQGQAEGGRADPGSRRGARPLRLGSGPSRLGSGPVVTERGAAVETEPPAIAASSD